MNTASFLKNNNNSLLISLYKILLVVANLVSRTGKYESVKEGYYHLQ